jgi:hypothetical protein
MVAYPYASQEAEDRWCCHVSRVADERPSNSSASPRCRLRGEASGAVAVSRDFRVGREASRRWLAASVYA